MVQQLFEKYKQGLQSSGKNMLYAQFCLIRLEVLPPDEIQVISPSELTDTYARDQRTALIDYYRAETKILVRVTTTIKEDEAIKASQATVVLSKSEMFDAMAQKNPNLARLKDGLGMVIESLGFSHHVYVFHSRCRAASFFFQRYGKCLPIGNGLTHFLNGWRVRHAVG